MSPELLHDRLQNAIDAISPGDKLGVVTALKGGVSAQMWVFEAGEEGRTLVARLPGQHIQEKDNAIDAEFRNLAAVGRAGIKAPQAIYLEPSSLGQKARIYVMSFVEGKADLGPELREGHLDQFARCLAKIHQLDVGAGDLSLVRRLQNPWMPRGEEADVALREPEIRKALEAFGPQEGDNPTVLRHGDMWPGNVLWKNGELAAVVDWENASLGDPLADLSICRLDLLWVFGWDAMEEFTESYLAHNPVATRLLPYFDLVASLRPMNDLKRWAPAYVEFGRPDITYETLARSHQKFTESALGAI